MLRVKIGTSQSMVAKLSSLSLVLLVLFSMTGLVGATALIDDPLTEEVEETDVYQQRAAGNGGTSWASVVEVNPNEGEQEDQEQLPPGSEGPSNIPCATDLPNVENSREIWDYLKSLGLPEVVVAGIIGNFYAEGGDQSGFDPDFHQQGGPAYGLAQWEPPRLGHLRDYAASIGKSEADLYVQLDFTYFEMTGTWPQGKEPQGPYDYTGDVIAQNNLDKILASSSPEEAAIRFLDYFERAGVRAEQKRANAAASAFSDFTGTASEIGDCAAGGSA